MPQISSKELRHFTKFQPSCKMEGWSSTMLHIPSKTKDWISEVLHIPCKMEGWCSKMPQHQAKWKVELSTMLQLPCKMEGWSSKMLQTHYTILRNAAQCYTILHNEQLNVKNGNVKQNDRLIHIQKTAKSKDNRQNRKHQETWKYLPISLLKFVPASWH